ncbi:mucin-15 isoform X2 [Pungitius pungitius]|uniref:mucin-15 isoform X2 n=1 Tax=Pungitius pungitius TaxID=134920 RepID=UPI002E0DBFC3
MGRYLRIAAGLFLLVQTFRLASLQGSTDSPGRTIDKSWLRNKKPGSQAYEEEGDYISGNVADGIPSGSMMVPTSEEENVSVRDAVKTANDMTDATGPPTTPQPEQPDATQTPSTPASGGASETQTEGEGHNATTATSPMSTTQPSQQTTAVASDGADLQATTPPAGPTQEPATKWDEATPSTDAGESNATMNATSQGANETSATTPATDATPDPTTLSPTTAAPTTAAPTTPAPTTAAPTTTAYTTADPTTADPTTPAAPILPGLANRTGLEGPSGPSGSSSGRGGGSARRRAWGVVLGTGVAVAIVALVALVILRKRHQKGFFHSKLVEDYPSDPVLRLDNSPPLDLDFGIGRSAYYNPALQGDKIQMENLPERR